MYEIKRTTRIPTDRLSALDLSKEAAEHGGDAYRVELDGQAQAGELLIVGDRAGWAWGANADWTDVLPGETPWSLAVRMLLTDEQLEALRGAAAEAGDGEQVASCDRALAGDEAARARCAQAIANAQSMKD